MFLKLLFLFFIIFSCKPTNRNLSQSKFIAAESSEQAGLTHYARSENAVTICVNDPGQRDDEIYKAAASWFTGLGKYTGEVPKDIRVVGNEEGGNDCAAFVILKNLGGEAAHTYMQSNPQINWDSNGGTWFGTYAVLVHEFGHAFGLYDTYDQGSRMSGNCVADQPAESVMCSPGSFETPQDDDLRGACTVFKNFEKSNGGGDCSSGSKEISSNFSSRVPENFSRRTKSVMGDFSSLGIDTRRNFFSDFRYDDSIFREDNWFRKTFNQRYSEQESWCPSEFLRSDIGITNQQTKFLLVLGLMDLGIEISSACFGTREECLNPHSPKFLLQPFLENQRVLHVSEILPPKLDPRKFKIWMQGYSKKFKNQMFCQLPNVFNR